MINNKRFLAVWTATLTLVLGLSLFAAAGLAQDNGEPASDPAPASAAETGAPAVALTLDKSGSVPSVSLGRSLVYTLVIDNPGDLPETVTLVSDVLPAGFEFLSMEPGSDVTAAPGETSGTLTWTDPILVPAGESRRLVYRVRAGATGFQENTAEAETLGGAVVGPAAATVTVTPSRAYLPLVWRAPVPPPLPYAETFDTGWPATWVVFTNYPGLEKNDWVWYGESPAWGFLSYEPDAWKGFSLIMYLGSGSAEWTDYRIVSTLRNRADKLAGIWFRGQYIQQTDGGGGWVGGYYLHIKPKDDTVYLWRIRPETHHFAQADVVAQKTPSSGITLGWHDVKIEVRGANIKVWLKKEDEPESAYRLMINWTDPYSTYLKGTVGFSTYGGQAVFNDITVTSLPPLGQ